MANARLYTPTSTADNDGLGCGRVVTNLHISAGEGRRTRAELRILDVGIGDDDFHADWFEA